MVKFIHSQRSSKSVTIQQFRQAKEALKQPKKLEAYVPINVDPLTVNRFDRQRDFQNQFDPVQALLQPQRQSNQQSYFLNKINNFKMTSDIQKVRKLASDFTTLYFNREKVFIFLCQHIDNQDSWGLLAALIRDFKNVIYRPWINAVTAMSFKIGRKLQTGLFKNFFDFLSLGFKASFKQFMLDKQPLIELFVLLFNHSNKYISIFSAEVLAFFLKQISLSQQLTIFLMLFISNPEGKYFKKSLTHCGFQTVRGPGKYISARGMMLIKSLLSNCLQCQTGLQIVSSIIQNIFQKITNKPSDQPTLLLNLNNFLQYLLQLLKQRLLQTLSAESLNFLVKIIDLLGKFLGWHHSQLSLILSKYFKLKQNHLNFQLNHLLLCIHSKNWNRVVKLENINISKYEMLILLQQSQEEKEVCQDICKILYFQKLDQMNLKELYRLFYLSKKYFKYNIMVEGQLTTQVTANTLLKSCLRILIQGKTNGIQRYPIQMFIMYGKQYQKLLKSENSYLQKFDYLFVNIQQRNIFEASCCLLSLFPFKIQFSPLIAFSGIMVSDKVKQISQFDYLLGAKSKQMSLRMLNLFQKEFQSQEVYSQLKKAIQLQAQVLQDRKFSLIMLNLQQKLKNFKVNDIKFLSLALIHFIKQDFQPYAKAAIKLSQELWLCSKYFQQLVLQNLKLFDILSSKQIPLIVEKVEWISQADKLDKQYVLKIFDRLAQCVNRRKINTNMRDWCQNKLDFYSRKPFNQIGNPQLQKIIFWNNKLISLIKIAQACNILPNPLCLLNQKLHEPILRIAQKLGVKSKSWQRKSQIDEQFQMRKNKSEKHVQSLIKMSSIQQNLFILYKVSFLNSPEAMIRRRVFQSLLAEDLQIDILQKALFYFLKYDPQTIQANEYVNKMQTRRLIFLMQVFTDLIEKMNQVLQGKSIIALIQLIMIQSFRRKAIQSKIQKLIHRKSIKSICKYIHHYSNPSNFFLEQIQKILVLKLKEINSDSFSEIPTTLQIISQLIQSKIQQLLSKEVLFQLQTLASHRDINFKIVNLLIKLAQSMLQRGSDLKLSFIEAIINAKIQDRFKDPLFKLLQNLPDYIITNLSDKTVNSLLESACNRLFGKYKQKSFKQLENQSQLMSSVINKVIQKLDVKYFLEKFQELFYLSQNKNLRFSLSNVVYNSKQIFSQQIRKAILGVNTIINSGLQPMFDQINFSTKIQIQPHSSEQFILFTNNLIFFASQSSLLLRQSALDRLLKLIGLSGAQRYKEIMQIEQSCSLRHQRAINKQYQFKSMSQILLGIYNYYKIQNQWPSKQHQSLAQLLTAQINPIKMIISLSQIKRLRGIMMLKQRCQIILLPYMDVILRGFLNEFKKVKKGMKTQWHIVSKQAISIYSNIIANQPEVQIKKRLRKLIFKSEGSIGYQLIDEIISRLPVNHDSISQIIRQKGVQQTQFIMQKKYTDIEQQQQVNGLQKFIRTKVLKYFNKLLLKANDLKKQKKIKLESHLNLIIVKILSKQSLSYYLNLSPGYILRIIKSLRKKDFDVRQGARACLISIIRFVGCSVVKHIFLTIKQQLVQSHQAHIFVYSINKILRGTEDIPLAIESGLGIILTPIFDQIFGKTNTQKQKETQMNLPQMSRRTALDSLNCIVGASNLKFVIEHLFQSLENQIKDMAIHETQLNKFDQIFNNLLAGMLKNPSFDQTVVTMAIHHIEIKQRLGNIQIQTPALCEVQYRLKQSNAKKSFQQTYQIQPLAATKKSIFSNNNIKKKDQYQKRMVMAVFGLGICQYFLHSSLFQINKMQNLANTIQKLSIDGLTSQSNRIVERSLRCLNAISKKKPLVHFDSALQGCLILLAKQATTDSSLCKQIFKIIRDGMIRKGTLSRQQTQSLIRSIKLINNPGFELIQPYQCLVNLVSKGVMSAQLQHLLLQIRQGIVLSHRENVRQLLKDIVLCYLSKYPVLEQVRQNYIKFTIRNLQSPIIQGRKAMLSMLSEFINIFNQNQINHYSSIIFIGILHICLKDNSNAQTESCLKVLNSIIKRNDKGKLLDYQKQGVSWIKSDKICLKCAGVKSLILLAKLKVNMSKQVIESLKPILKNILQQLKSDLEERVIQFSNKRKLGQSGQQSWVEIISMIKQSTPQKINHLLFNELILQIMQLVPQLQDSENLAAVFALTNYPNSQIQRQSTLLICQNQAAKNVVLHYTDTMRFCFKYNFLFKNDQVNFQFLYYLLKISSSQLRGQLYQQFVRIAIRLIKLKEKRHYYISVFINLIISTIKQHPVQPSQQQTIVNLFFKLYSVSEQLINLDPNNGQLLQQLRQTIILNIDIQNFHKLMLACQKSKQQKKRQMKEVKLRSIITDQALHAQEKLRKSRN